MAAECRAQLQCHMPELLGPYERVCSLVGEDDLAEASAEHVAALGATKGIGGAVVATLMPSSLPPHPARSAVAISRGGVATGIFGNAYGLKAAAEAGAEKMKAVLGEMQAMPRAGVPDDIVSAAIGLASDESSFVNGTDIVVDGGAIGGRRFSVVMAGRQATAPCWNERTRGAPGARSSIAAAARRRAAVLAKV